MEVILIRHYKTLLNASGQIMGWDDSPQVENGLSDMVFIEAELRRRNIQPDTIYSSALGRAQQTADYFADKLSVKQVHSAAQLNEVNYGSLSRKSKKWVSRNFPKHKNCPDFIYPEGESFNQMQARSVTFVELLVETLNVQTVLCVAHAGVVRGLVSHFLNLDYAAQLKRKISHRYIGVLNFDGNNCTGYDEYGVASGFNKDGAISLPYICQPKQSRSGRGVTAQ